VQGTQSIFAATVTKVRAIDKEAGLEEKLV
jgi:hypothetical protein